MNADGITTDEEEVCMFCCQPIESEAIVCPHCQSVLDADEVNKITSQEKLTAAWYIVSLFFPIIGLLAGIAFLTRRETGNKSSACLVMSFLGSIGYGVLYFLLFVNTLSRVFGS